MTNCERHQADLLDYLFDVLDDDERRRVREHLEDCADCQEELVRARSQQRLLALAAKREFPAVRFEVSSSTRETIPLPSHWRPHWGWLAMAAGVLLAVGGLGIFLQQQPRDSDDKVAFNQPGNGPGVNQIQGGPDPVRPFVPDPSRTNAAATDPEAWGLSLDGLTSVIWTQKAGFKVGESIHVQYRVKNVGEGSSLLWDLGFWPNHKIVVKDETGTEVSLTRIGQRRRKMFQPGSDPGAINPTPVESGKYQDSPSQDVTQLFVLDKPGKYAIQYFYKESQREGWDGELPSNIITITITK